MVEKFTERLHVSKRIVSLLSTSTYQKSFASAIRELVSNAYDADALSVRVTISSDFKKIEIEDDGNGMTKQEFGRYLTIAGSKSSDLLTRKYLRKRIGHFGVGFLSIFPFCKELEITTTVENSDFVLSAIIPAIDYQESNKGKQDVEDIPIKGTIREDKSQRLKHFTKITLVSPTHVVNQYFTKPETKKRDSVLTWDPFKKFKWELQEDLPLAYKPGSESVKIISYKEPVGINVFLNEEPLYRHELNENVIEFGTEKIAGVTCKYVVTTDHTSIKPLEARGMKLRVNNTGIGVRTDFELRRDRGFSRLHWLAGEIQFSEEIKPYLTLARDKFVSSPLVDEIMDFFADKLKKWAYYIEDVAVAEKEIEQTIKDTKKGRTASKEEVIEKNISKLEEKGYKIVRTNVSNTDKSKNPIEVDKVRKTITVHEDNNEYKKDYLTVSGKKYQIEFSKDFDDETPCRFKTNRIIEMNQSYPFFKSKSYGKMYQKLHAFFLVAAQENNSAKQMYEYLVANFPNEFKETL